MSQKEQEEKQIVGVFLTWVKDGGLAGWIEHFLNQGDDSKLKDISQVYTQLKTVFGF